MITLYSAKYLLPLSSPPLADGALLVREGRIVAVGRRRELQQLAPEADRHRFPDGILLPPLVNAHTHLELTGFPVWAAELDAAEPSGDFVDWIERLIRVKRQVTAEDFASAVAQGIEASLAAGTGAIGDILSQFPARQAHRSSPLYGRLYYEMLGRQGQSATALRRTVTQLLHSGHCGRLQPGMAPHAPYSIGADFLEEILQFACDNRFPCTMHLAESPAEREFLHDGSGAFVERFYPLVGWGEEIPAGNGLSPVAWLAERGGLAAWNLLVHGVQVDAADLQLLAAAGARVVLCPRSNARLQVGQPPLELYRAANIAVALGTDSLASNDSLSVWDEIAFAWPSFSRCYSADEMLRIATCNGADALGLGGEMGRLQPGSGAHFQVLECAAELEPAQLPEWLCRQAAKVRVAQLVLAGKECLPIT